MTAPCGVRQISSTIQLLSYLQLDFRLTCCEGEPDRGDESVRFRLEYLQAGRRPRL